MKWSGDVVGRRVSNARRDGWDPAAQRLEHGDLHVVRDGRCQARVATCLEGLRLLPRLGAVEDQPASLRPEPLELRPERAVSADVELRRTVSPEDLDCSTASRGFFSGNSLSDPDDAHRFVILEPGTEGAGGCTRRG